MALPVLSFTTASVSASSSLDVEQAFINRADIYKIKVVPNIVGGTAALAIYKENARTNLVYQTSNFSGNLVDPVKDDNGVITEQKEGFIFPYEDLDNTNKLHIRITNNDNQAKTYTISITYEGPIKRTVIKNLTGTKNGAADGTGNKVFNLPTTHDASGGSKVIVFSAGHVLHEGNGTNGFTRSGTQVTLGTTVPAPESTDDLDAMYNEDPSIASSFTGSFVAEVPAGVKDDSNKVFTMSFTPDAVSKVMVFSAGHVLHEGNATNGFTRSGVTITLGTTVPAPSASDDIIAMGAKPS